MRTTTHHGRGHKGSAKGYSEKHNDRNYDVTKADNIDSMRMKDNEYWNFYHSEKMTFEDVELKFYEDKFGKQLKATNEKYIANRHPERVKTMAEWKASKRNAPEETIRQVGKVEEHIDKDLLLKIEKDYSEWQQKWNEEHGEVFTVLTKALHADEAVPHIQERRVWFYRDAKTKDFKIGQEKALEKAGVPLPHPDRKPSRYNNRKITFDKMCRDKWIDICEAHGLKIEREPIPDGKHNQTKELYIRNKYERLSTEIERMTEELAELQTQSEVVQTCVALDTHLYYAERNIAELEGGVSDDRLDYLGEWWQDQEEWGYEYTPSERLQGNNRERYISNFISFLKAVKNEITRVFSTILNRPYGEQKKINKQSIQNDEYEIEME